MHITSRGGRRQDSPVVDGDYWVQTSAHYSPRILIPGFDNKKKYINEWKDSFASTACLVSDEMGYGLHFFSWGLCCGCARYTEYYQVLVHDK